MEPFNLGDFESAGELLRGAELSLEGATDGTACVRHDAIDLDAWKGVVAAIPELAELVAEAGRLAPNLPFLLRDLFWTFFKPVVHLSPAVPTRPSCAPNRQILERTMEAVAWKDARAAGTVDRQFPSALATKVVGARLIRAVGKDQAARVASTVEDEAAVATLLARATAYDDLADRTPARAKDLHERAAAARAEAHARLGRLMPPDLDPITLEEVDRAARFGLLEARDVVDAEGKALDAFDFEGAGGHGTSPGQFRRNLSLAEHLRLSERLKAKSRFKEVAELAGRMRRIALHKQREKIDREPDEIAGVERGADLPRVLSAERMWAGHPAGAALFGLKFIEGQLLQYKVEATQKQGRGPVIAVEDQSSSEQRLYGPHRGIDWNKAAIMGLAAVCGLQGRDLAVIEFSGAGNLRTTVYPKGRMTVDEALDLTDRTFNGGTYYDEWMVEALRLAAESAFDKADVILLSDGLANVEEATAERWNRTREARGMRAYAVMTGPDCLHAARVLGGLCDAVLTVQDLADDASATDAIFSI